MVVVEADEYDRSFLKLAPNPAKDKILVTWEGNMNDKTNLKII